MNSSIIFADFDEALATIVAGRSWAPSIPDPLPVSPWVAMSLLQKAIRRGEENWAQRAAATLLQIAPERLWRRLCCIAFEDVGVAAIDAVGLATAAMASKSFRGRLGGEWQVASTVVSLLTAAPKCRAADDLIVTAGTHPDFERTRLSLSYRDIRELIAIATSECPIQERAIAAWYATGTARHTPDRLRSRQGRPEMFFDGLSEAGHSDTVVEIAREGFRRTGEVLAPFVALLHRDCPPSDPVIVDDTMPPTTMAGAVPGWALDMFSREGLAAIRLFLRTDCETVRMVKRCIPQPEQPRFIGELIFSVESARCRSLMRWPQGDELRRVSHLECHGPRVPDATDFLTAMWSDIDCLNRVRAHAQ